MSETLLIGIGNISRGDDGIGWLFADDIETNFSREITVEKVFQLVVEDAYKILNYDLVIFVDASVNYFLTGFNFRKLNIPDEIKTSFTSHAQAPENIIFLAAQLFNYTGTAYVLEIGGQDWELGEELSGYGRQNLHRALTFLKKWLAGKTENQLLASLTNA